ncbi:MAG: GNAT family N-acetyltransferase [Bacteroidia bacterium]
MSLVITLPGEALPQEYFDVRYEVLRKPLGGPRGSELLTDDNTAIHASISIDNKIVAVGRIALIAGDGSVKDPVGSNCPAFEPLGEGTKSVLTDDKGEAFASRLRPAVQVRQMGTLPEFQGKGLAAKVLAALEETAKQHWNARTGWLQARIAAIPFYEKCGWTAYGEEYDVNKVGPHRSMWKKL